MNQVESNPIQISTELRRDLNPLGEFQNGNPDSVYSQKWMELLREHTYFRTRSLQDSRSGVMILSYTDTTRGYFIDYFLIRNPLYRRVTN